MLAKPSKKNGVVKKLNMAKSAIVRTLDVFDMFVSDINKVEFTDKPSELSTSHYSPRIKIFTVNYCGFIGNAYHNIPKYSTDATTYMIVIKDVSSGKILYATDGMAVLGDIDAIVVLDVMTNYLQTISYNLKCSVNKMINERISLL